MVTVACPTHMLTIYGSSFAKSFPISRPDSMKDTVQLPIILLYFPSPEMYYLILQSYFYAKCIDNLMSLLPPSSLHLYLVQYKVISLDKHEDSLVLFGAKDLSTLGGCNVTISLQSQVKSSNTSVIVGVILFCQF